MADVRGLVGTRKGAFILTSDGKREKWDVSGPHFAGWEIYHVKGSPVDPDRLYASQSSGWFGQVIQRSNDGGKPGRRLATSSYDGVPGTHHWYDGTPHPWEFKRVWHLEPSLTDPDTVYAGVEDAAMFRTTDGGQSWHELAGLRGHGSGSRWQPGAGSGDVLLEVEQPATLRAVLDALEARYPTLRGTIRDHVTRERRALIRFFACEEDLSHDSPDAALPDEVVSGAEPLYVVGAIAGGTH